jgi:hypothetical protein
VAVVPGVPAAPPAAGQPPAEGGGTYVFGTEKVEVSMLLEITNFAEVAAK